MNILGEGAFRPPPQPGPDGIGHEVGVSELDRRRGQINGVIHANNLANPFSMWVM